MAASGPNPESNNGNPEFFRIMVELMQLHVEKALNEFEHVRNAEHQLNEMQTWFLQARGILDAPSMAQTRPGFSQAEFLQMLRQAMKRIELPVEKLHRRRPKTDAEKILKHAAESGLKDYELLFEADGSGIATIDGIKVELTATLAKLLSLLADPKIESIPDAAPWINGDFIPFKSNQVLIDRMQSILNRKVLGKHLRNYIHRLRNGFESAGLNKYLIQTADGQTRLARRHPAAIPQAP